MNQQHSGMYLQAYATFNQKDHTLDSGVFARSNRDGSAAVDANLGQVTNERSSSRGSSTGACAAASDDEGQFISSLMGAQQARMRVYV